MQCWDPIHILSLPPFLALVLDVDGLKLKVAFLANLCELCLGYLQYESQGGRRRKSWSGLWGLTSQSEHWGPENSVKRGNRLSRPAIRARRRSARRERAKRVELETNLCCSVSALGLRLFASADFVDIFEKRAQSGTKVTCRPGFGLVIIKILTRVICSCLSAARPARPYQRRCPWLAHFHDCFMTLPDPPWKQKSACTNILSSLTRSHICPL